MEINENSQPPLILNQIENNQNNKDEKFDFNNSFRYFFESSPDLCYLVSPNGEILDLNHTALTILGVNKDEVIGKQIIPIVYPHSQQRAIELAYKWKERGKLINEEIIISTVHGDRTVILSVDDVKDQTGKVLYSILIQKDISELKQAIDEAEGILNAAADGIRIVTKDFKVMKINDTMAQLADIPIDHAIGMNCQEMFGSDACCGTKECSLVKSLKTGERFTTEDVRKTKNGKYIPCLVTVTPYKNAMGQIIGIIEDFQDISTLKEKENRIKSEKERTEIIQNTTPSAIFTVDKERKITSWNKKAEELTGYTRDEIIGKDCTLFAESPCKEKCGLYAEDVDKPVIDKECTIKRKDGMIRTISKNVDFLKDNNGTILGGVESFHDITEKKEMELSILSEKKFSESLLLSLPGIFYLMNPEGRLLRWNHNLETVSEYTSDELAHKYVFDLISEEEKQIIREKINEVSSKNRTSWEINIISKSGTKTPYYCTGFPISYEGIIHVIGAGIDLTELKKTRFELEKAYEKLQDLNNSLEDRVKKQTEELKTLLDQRTYFITQLGHDLGTPLSPMINLLPLVEQQEENEKLKDMLSVVMRNCILLNTLVKKTRKYSAITSTCINKGFDKLNVFSIVENLVKEKEEYFKNSSILVENQIDKDLNLQVDMAYLNDIFDELLSNAARYSPDGGTIILNSKIDGTSIIFSVKDSGIGLSSDQLPYVFDEFYKADKSRHDLNSHGLGLAIMKHMVHGFGGKVWVESDGPEKGSTFYFTLPLSEN